MVVNCNMFSKKTTQSTEIAIFWPVCVFLMNPNAWFAKKCLMQWDRDTC